MRLTDDIAPARWLTDRLVPGSYRVDMLVPPVFAAYARILHPLIHWYDEPVIIRWSELAQQAGIVRMNRLIQFPSLAAPLGLTAAEQPGYELPDAQLHALVHALADVSGTAATCYAAVAPELAAAEPPPGGTVRIGRNAHVLYIGTLNDIHDIDGDGQPIEPNAWWPAERSWCVAAGRDLHSTYLGGPAQLVETVLTHPELEALPALPEDPITLDADQAAPHTHER